MIAVHCTHGFNRTGFLISSYLVEKFDYDIAAAIQAFAASRPPGIYKQDYIDELFKRYGDEEDEPLHAPDLPEWCFDEEETDDHYTPNEPPIQMPTLPSAHPNNNNNSRKRRHQQEEEEDTNDDDSQVQNDEEEENNEDGGATTSGEHKTMRKKRKNENIRLDATFMKGVGGVILMTNRQKVNALQHMIQDMCEWKGSGFPGLI